MFQFGPNDVCDKWDVSLTFGPFQQVDLQNCLGWGLPPSDQQPHHWSRLLEGLHRSAVNHLGHVHIVYTQHAVIHPADGKVLIQLFNGNGVQRKPLTLPI